MRIVIVAAGVAALVAGAVVAVVATADTNETARKAIVRAVEKPAKVAPINIRDAEAATDRTATPTVNAALDRDLVKHWGQTVRCAPEAGNSAECMIQVKVRDRLDRCGILVVLVTLHPKPGGGYRFTGQSQRSIDQICSIPRP